MLLLMIFAFLAGLFTIFSPCILPILPILLVGTVRGKLQPLGIVIGLIFSFTIFTLALTALVHATGISANVLRYVAIVIVCFFGFAMIFPRLGDWVSKLLTPFANFGQKIQQKSVGNGFWSGIFLGIALGLLWTPCAGPILAAVVALVATQEITSTAILMTLLYSIGAAIPIFLIMYGGLKAIQTSRFLSSHAERLRQIFGCLAILSALLIAFNWDMILQKKIIQFFSPILVEDNSLVKQELEKLRKKNSKNANLNAIIADVLGNYGKAPEIVGIVNWINSRPLSLMQLKGKVVLIDFWTYSCINCLRTLPYIEKWYADYGPKGFVVIGVHTPEFEFEKDSKNVAKAASQLGVSYPVAQDNDYQTWEAFHNSYWPAHYLIDQEGNIRLVHFGEGKYAETENAIRHLLKMSALNLEEPKRSIRPLSPETYLGSLRAEHYTPENLIQTNQTILYHYKKPLEENEVGLKGKWKVEDERITSEGEESYLEGNFLAKQIYLVLAGSSPEPLEVYLEGKLVKKIAVDGDRKYDILNTVYGWHKISLKVPQGISAYAFTFGDEKSSTD